MIDYDLVIVAGSGNMLPSVGLDGLRVAIIERDRFGGTCLNRVLKIGLSWSRRA
jgi:pyruvate/2-oxoglutarate dehydrogenase complex dihydrolipoamide dehydrogenase (E3) component